MERFVQVIADAYFDSVVLMGAAARVKALPGVSEAASFMGTAANKQLLHSAGFDGDGIDDAGSGDVIIAVAADSLSIAEAAATAAVDVLRGKRPPVERGAGAPSVRRRSMAGVLRDITLTGGEANLALISLPGAYVETEAMLALQRNLNTFIFSDNVPVDAEIRLKTEASRRGLLCMGPDCGTAWIAGTGIGFSNEVPRGHIGIISASGTGLQAVACGLAAGGEGISHGIGVGGRDLSREVGGRMTLLALEMLADDPMTEMIVIISKPPAPETLHLLDRVLADIRKPVIVGCLGAAEKVVGNVTWVSTLAETVDTALAMWQGRARSYEDFTDMAYVHDVVARTTLRPGPLLGLFVGGTLAHEAEVVLNTILGPVTFGDESALSRGEHSILDLGDDQYTQGRPHPMIDPQPRADRIREHVDAASIVLVDLVLGRNSHPDPAAPLVESIDALRARLGALTPTFIASVTGTSQDVQNRSLQETALRRAGVLVLPDNVQAAKLAARLLGTQTASGQTAPAIN